jgi:hypothetical protein
VTRLLLATGLLAWMAGASIAASQAIVLHYDVYYLVLRVVGMDVVSRLDPASYHATAELRTTGVLEVFASWVSKVNVSGMIDGTTLRPARYQVDSTYRDRRQRIDLEYGGAGSVRSEVDGVLTDGERDEVPTELRDGTIDPLTAGSALAERLAATGTCAGTFRVFDGLRRYDLRYDDLGTSDLAPSSRDPYQGSARHCVATVDPIAGFLRTGDRAGERATRLSAWLAPPLAGAMAVTVRMEIESTRGGLAIHLAHAAPDTADRDRGSLHDAAR